MAQIKCLYCSASNKEGEEDCQVCGLPLAMSVPQQPVSEPAASASTNASLSDSAASTASAINQPRPVSRDSSISKNNDLLKDAVSQFQQKRAELALEFEQQEKKRQSGPIQAILIVTMTVVLCIVAAVLQRKPENASNNSSDTTPVVLDQSVGAPPVETSSPTPSPEETAATTNLAQAEKAIQAGRYVEAERLLSQMSPKDKDYNKAQELRQSIQSKLPKKGKK